MSDVIIIDLDTIDHPSLASTSEGFIQVEAREQVFRCLIKDIIKPALPKPSSDRPSELDVLTDRRHDALLVTARRGEGKTTFLTQILSAIADQSYKSFVHRNSTSTNRVPELYSLGIIDPTLIETKQNIIVVIIEKIRKAVMHRRKNIVDANDDYQRVEGSLRKLAQGLYLLDGIGEQLYAGKDWVDPDFVLDEGLENAAAAHDFELRFRQFIASAVSYVGCDAFVLAIDDVDTWFERGWPVLEALRKYLATTQLKVILSGDLDLYTLLVRRQQWDQMNPSFLRAERMRAKVDGDSAMISKIGRMVDSLQDQYLIKIARPENRVELRNLEYHADGVGIAFRGGNIAGCVSEREFLAGTISEVFGVSASKDIDLYREQILRLPTRSALQLLAAASHDNAAGEDHSVALDTLRHVSWTAVTSLGLDVSDTRNPNPNALIPSLSHWMAKSRLWHSLARCYPDGAEAEKNLAAMYVGAALLNVFKRSPGKMIDYWIKISLVREKLDRGELPYQSSETEAPRDLKSFMSHVGATALESSVQFASRVASWEAIEGGRENTKQLVRGIRLSGASVPLGRIRETSPAARELYGLEYDGGKNGLDREAFRALATGNPDDTRRLLAGLPPALRGFHRKLSNSGWQYGSRRGTEAAFQVYFANGIEDLAKRLSGSAKRVALLAHSRVVSGQQAESGNYSLLRLLGFVAETLEIGRTPNRTNLQSIVELVTQCSQPRSYPTQIALGVANSESYLEFDSDSDDFEDAYYSENEEAFSFEHALLKWMLSNEVAAVDFGLAPITLARVWTRFTYTFGNIRDELKHRDSRYLGVYMHRAIIGFLHALGFELMRSANARPPAKTASNPVRSGEVFVQLLKEIYSDSSQFGATKEFKFFDLIFSCPLWGFFIAREEHDEVEKVRRLEPNDSIYQFYSDRLSEYLDDASHAIFATQFRSSKPDEGPIDFDGLYFLLNTVQMQGGSEFDRTAGRLLRQTTEAWRKRTSPGRVNPSQ
ncbi:hypothetical protein [Rhizobium ruizarguesonis]|uniref:hypothetical protein n=1 Tax=Rhizobium ruizarguesonis TaxID=2081791 RepID=UPI0013BDE2A4|nr:hypothetical protein [Rhizobium ruizarguesonis]NEH61727.1 hypothetical protein [Rhizobium ruizarguesonis]